MHPSKLLHVVVALGAGMSAGWSGVACGGATVDADSARDGAADSPGRYGRIANDAGYGRISVDAARRPDAEPFDAGDDADDGDPADANEAG